MPWVSESYVDAALKNRAYRRVLVTERARPRRAQRQLVAMSLRPGEAIGRERHARVRQSFLVVRGHAWVFIGDRVRAVGPGDRFVVPAGVTHDVCNASRARRLQLLTVYAPPNHLPGTVHATKAAAGRDRADAAFGRRADRRHTTATALRANPHSGVAEALQAMRLAGGRPSLADAVFLQGIEDDGGSVSVRYLEEESWDARLPAGTRVRVAFVAIQAPPGTATTPLQADVFGERLREALGRGWSRRKEGSTWRWTAEYEIG